MDSISISEYKSLLKKGNKYGAKKKEYRGRMYHSTREMEYAVELDWKKYSGMIKDIKPQFKIPIIISGVHICDYIIDFRIELNDSTYEYHEVKGAETDLWKLKWKLVKTLYPGYKFVLIK